MLDQQKKTVDRIFALICIKGLGAVGFVDTHALRTLSPAARCVWDKERGRNVKAERYRGRRRLATPSPTPSPPPAPRASGWFKSLDRLSRKKSNNKVDKESGITTEDESVTQKSLSKTKQPLSPAKNLRFFGDTDPESDTHTQNYTKTKNQAHKHSTLRKTISNSSTGIDEINRSELSGKSHSLSNIHRQSKREESPLRTHKRNLHNISEIQSNSETESHFDRKPPIGPYDRRSRSHSSSKNVKPKSRADVKAEEKATSSELRGSRQELARDMNFYHEPHSIDVVFGRRRRRTSLTQIVRQISATTFKVSVLPATIYAYRKCSPALGLTRKLKVTQCAERSSVGRPSPSICVESALSKRASSPEKNNYAKVQVNRTYNFRDLVITPLACELRFLTAVLVNAVPVSVTDSLTCSPERVLSFNLRQKLIGQFVQGQDRTHTHLQVQRQHARPRHPTALTSNRLSRFCRNRRRTPGGNSGGSSTEGESSRQSQRSVVYLHATTVGDIPDPGVLARNRSRDDVSSVNSSQLQVRTTTKSFSIFAPWTPRHHDNDVHYAQRPKKTRSRDKETLKRSSASRNLADDRPNLQKNKSYSQTTLTKRPQNNRLSASSTTLYRKSEKRSVENLAKPTTLARSKNVGKDTKKSQSTEVLHREGREKVSRSISMPKDKDKKSGWFKLSNKNKKTDINTRRCVEAVHVLGVQYIYSSNPDLIHSNENHIVTSGGFSEGREFMRIMTCWA
ncbi:hypothetical protein EVAR_42706_1 [Eumeta japonica]|uniref:Uncharacterized protein n=1 Tax=Eumeta variegata TaxID=151549 RepID=A0A4C1X038_EUMVA|nr:hypothetical protein EVAR_42706_1 [Eumeta japonica]